MEINVQELKKVSNKLNAHYKNLKTVQLNLFNCISNICKFDWIDNYSQKFLQCIEEEKIETNSYQDYIKDSVVLDLFAGSGNLGIEAISNGARIC